MIISFDKSIAKCWFLFKTYRPAVVEPDVTRQIFPNIVRSNWQY